MAACVTECRVVTPDPFSHHPSSSETRRKLEEEQLCCICLEQDLGGEEVIPSSEDCGPAVKVPLSLTLPCACQYRVAKPAQVHEACLRQWLATCAKRAAESRDRSEEPAPTCPLCRADLPASVANPFKIPARVRAALAQCPRPYALKALTAADGVVRNVVTVADKVRDSDTVAGQRVLSMHVEGLETTRPLLVARATRTLGSARRATKFHVYFCGADGKEILVATVARNTFGTRWHIDTSDGEPRCVVEYEANRFGNRPRAMRVELPSTTSDVLTSRAPEYSPQMRGYCLDFYGRARLASVRNFQLINPRACAVSGGAPDDDEARSLLLFGRWSKNEFRLDVKPPFSLVDAFGIAVSSYATKIACC